ncbi:hypothetical protein CsSME_00026707 [Camellia sinensis var. sinensis]
MFSTGEAQETAKNDLIGYLKVLEGELGDKPYFGGERPLALWMWHWFHLIAFSLLMSSLATSALWQNALHLLLGFIGVWKRRVCQSIFLTSTRSMTPCWSAKRSSMLSKSLEECLTGVLYVIQFRSSLLGSPFICLFIFTFQSLDVMFA